MKKIIGDILVFILGIGVGFCICIGINYSKFCNENKNLVEDNITNIDVEVKPTDYMFAKSSVELIDESRLEGLSKFELEVAKNEIFARYGHDFSSATLRQYFDTKSWYKREDGKKVSVSDLNKLEQANVALIDKYLEKYKK